MTGLKEIRSKDFMVCDMDDEVHIIPEFTVAKNSKHLPNKRCWCEPCLTIKPENVYSDDDCDKKVYLHNYVH